MLTTLRVLVLISKDAVLQKEHLGVLIAITKAADDCNNGFACL